MSLDNELRSCISVHVHWGLNICYSISESQHYYDKVKVGNAQEMAQSERNPHSKNQLNPNGPSNRQDAPAPTNYNEQL